MRRYPQAPEVIQAQMLRCGLDLNSLSEQSGISTAVLRGILTGRAETISTRCICALASSFGYPAAAFIDLLSRPE